MAMSAGSVSISDAGVVSGTGLARAMFDAHIAAEAAAGGFVNEDTPPAGISGAQALAMNVAIKRIYARMATAYATAQVAHIAANAKAKVLTTDGDLQRIPVTMTDTEGPASTKYLGIE